MDEESVPQEIPATGSDADRVLHTVVGRLTGGLSPTSLATAYLDWHMHLLGSPSKQAELASLAATKWLKASNIAATCWTDGGDSACQSEMETDKRFRDPAWKKYPFNVFSQWFLLEQQWWDAATQGLHGVEPKHEQMVHFAARQALDMMAPANFAATNPVVINRTQKEGGANLVRGLQNWIQDFNQFLTGQEKPHPDYRVGDTIAATPGSVVYRNQLIELIHYAPTTKKVRPEPILIVPAWIMKYYILDLSAHNSLVSYLRDQGFEVFIVSWKNPDAEDADLSMDDYVNLGVQAALDTVTSGRPDARVHGVGYCLGGTLFSIAAAAMARAGDKRLATLSLLAAQVDFSEAGELSLFINESQIAFLEDIMKSQGYLRADQMAGAFKMLRSNDLIWSRVVRHYLLGERTEMNDLMAWNADATRMPAKMHSQYLHWLFLDNQLARGQYVVNGNQIALTDMKMPIFCVGTEKDHVSPWKSAYKINLLTDTDVTFLLASGGHNGGILSEPGHANRHYRSGHKTEGANHVSPEKWLKNSPQQDGSWWPEWCNWLSEHSGPPMAVPKRKLPDLCAAPGSYVFG